MNLQTVRSFTSAVVLLLAFGLAVNVQAAAVSEVQVLQQAHAILAGADHDYQGHRVKAMASITAACKLLGANVRGDGKSKEPQTDSDAQLRQAQALLQQLRDTVAANGQKRILVHIDNAIKELTIALTIR